MLDRLNDSKKIYNLGYSRNDDEGEDYIDMCLAALGDCEEGSEEYNSAVEGLDECYPHRFYIRGNEINGWMTYDLYSLDYTDGFETADDAKNYIREHLMD